MLLLCLEGVSGRTTWFKQVAGCVCPLKARQLSRNSTWEVGYAPGPSFHARRPLWIVYIGKRRLRARIEKAVVESLITEDN